MVRAPPGQMLITIFRHHRAAVPPACRHALDSYIGRLVLLVPMNDPPRVSGSQFGDSNGNLSARIIARHRRHKHAALSAGNGRAVLFPPFKRANKRGVSYQRNIRDGAGRKDFRWSRKVQRSNAHRHRHSAKATYAHLSAPCCVMPRVSAGIRSNRAINAHSAVDDRSFVISHSMNATLIYHQNDDVCVSIQSLARQR